MQTTYVVKEYADGGLYEGQARLGSDGKTAPHGQGRRLLPNGDLYTGAWQGGQRHGLGVSRTQGRELRGIFEHDRSPTTGTLTYADHRIYRGDLAAGGPHGHGCMIWPGSDRTHTGDFVSGQRQGYGIMRTPEAVYSGHWHNDLPNDPSGSFEYANGDVYRGAVVDGMAHGLGEQRIHSDGRRLRGVFDEDCLPSVGTIVWRDRRSWQGPVKDALPAGRGTMDLASGWRVRGSIFGGGTPARGTATTRDHPDLVYEGALRDGRPFGEGTCVWPRHQLKARVCVDHTTSWSHLYERARLSAQLAALCDTRGNSLRGRQIYRLPCGHLDSDQHLKAMQKIASAHLSRNKPRSAQMSLRCGISTCRQPLDAVLRAPDLADLPRATALETFFSRLQASLPANVEAAPPGEVHAFLVGLEAAGLQVPEGNPPQAP